MTHCICVTAIMIFILRNLLFFISLNKMTVLMNLYSKEAHLIFRGEANLFFRFWPDSRSEIQISFLMLQRKLF